MLFDYECKDNTFNLNLYRLCVIFNMYYTKYQYYCYYESFVNSKLRVVYTSGAILFYIRIYSYIIILYCYFFFFEYRYTYFYCFSLYIVLFVFFFSVYIYSFLSIVLYYTFYLLYILYCFLSIYIYYYGGVKKNENSAEWV